MGVPDVEQMGVNVEDAVGGMVCVSAIEGDIEEVKKKAPLGVAMDKLGMGEEDNETAVE